MQGRMFRRLPAVLLASASLAGIAPVHAASTDAPQSTTAQYRDWQLHCVAVKDDSKTCEVAGVAPTPDGKNVAARVVVGRPDPDKPAQIVIQLPPGVWLPDGASLTVPGGKAPVRAEFKQCLQVCFAQADIDDATIAAMKAADKPATLSVVDAQRRPVTLPISLNGFKAAEEAMSGK
ncbi:invasion associated locus B family protein [Pleomorphomonas oryzae]|uniref:invasion associated locus B family protein n=1 Tax=Pleomorphomonas oryzae TaxID=261934 RepID=UPI00047A2B36|nr:invasion associated locus B family protein [Pleomorphomonas oryzae]